LRDRIELALREGVDEVVRERLAGAIRHALNEQRGSDGFDDIRLADSIRYELAESLRGELTEAVKNRIAESLRSRLADAIEAGVAQAQAS